MKRKLNIVFLSFCILSLFLSWSGNKKNKLHIEKEEIIKVLEKFQQGYTNRDTTIVEEYVEELFTNDILIIGTGASEWCKNSDDVIKLVRNDWKYWGDLKINIGEAKIRVANNISWIAVTGTSTRNFESEEYIYDRYGFNDINRILASKNLTRKIKLLEIITDAADLLREVELTGTKFVYPIRVAGSLVKENGKWKFKQMVFSYPFPRRLIINN